MLALTDREPPYFGGISSRFPPGEEALAGSIAAGYAVADLVVATGARRVLARTPRFASAVAALPGTSIAGRFEEGTLFAVPQLGEPLRIDRDTVARRSSTPWPTFEIVARRAGVVSVAQLDRCHFRETLRLGPLSFTHEPRLPGNEIWTLKAAAGEVIIHHESRRAVFRLPRSLRPEDRIDLTCAER
jgi:hypothetical protein